MWRLIVGFLILNTATQTLANDNEYLIRSISLPDDLNFMPTLGNGHLGYTVFGDAIYMNGIYNGRGGNSRRARMPNWLNLSMTPVVQHSSAHHGGSVGTAMTATKLYEMNLYDGYFRWRESIPKLGLEIEQRTYAHRFYNRALIYELLVQRTEIREPLTLKLTQSAGDVSLAFNFTPLSVNDSNAHRMTEDSIGRSVRKVLKGVTKIVEHELFQKQIKTIFVVFNDELEQEKLLQMTAGQRELYYSYILTADEDETVARSEMETILALEPAEMLRKHTEEWHKFWQRFNIQIGNDMELSHTINAGIFYLASSLPSLNTHQATDDYYGLSPTGLGRGQRDDDYEGHNFWDTEIWMFPVVTQLSIEWAQQLLGYRKRLLQGAQYNANITGYKGARYPWESAYTGTEVTNPCCPEVATHEVHITADIAIAFKQYYIITHNDTWLCEDTLPILVEIANFLASRVVWNPNTEKYHIQNVMGPDEDHANVNDSIFTNFSFKIALEFAIYAHRTCGNINKALQMWQDIADKLLLLYDAKLDYHPEYAGYQFGVEVKQADVILLGYPLQFSMNSSTRLNDLHTYESVTRVSGPAMTWSMFAINFLDINETEKANKYFESSYKKYARKEFKVWSEVQIGFNGAANFLTGIGGFLQAIINGYAGIRYSQMGKKSIMEIKTRRLLPNSKAYKIHGLYFADALFDLNVYNNSDSDLTCTSIGIQNLELLQGTEKYQIFKGFSIDLKDQQIYIETIEQ